MPSDRSMSCRFETKIIVVCWKEGIHDDKDDEGDGGNEGGGGDSDQGPVYKSSRKQENYVELNGNTKKHTHTQRRYNTIEYENNKKL